jgi:hypothetical protein
MQGSTSDSVLQNRIDFMTKAADYFKTKKCTKQEADMRWTIYNTRKSPNPAGLVNIAILYSQAGEYPKADTLLTTYIANFPDSIYGYDWRGRVNFSIDTTMSVEPYVSRFVSNYQKTLDIALTDKIRYRGQGVRAALSLTGYYNNVKSNRDSAYAYLLKGFEIDSTNAQIKSIKEIFDKQPAKGQKPAGKTTGKPSASLRKPSDKS